MKKTIPFIILSMLFLVNCGESSDTILNADPEIIEPDDPITTNVRMFIFGHSLINHDPPVYPTPSNETAVPHWLHFLAQEADFDLAANGQYGFLPQHRNLPPISQWGFDHVRSVWDSDTQSFQDADFNTILLTAANFIQYQPPTENYYNEDFSPVNATNDIFQWAQGQEEEMKLYIYENWPDMASFISGGSFEEITAEEFSNYNDYTLNEFHQWWLDYQDEVIADLQNPDVKMIPVGPILAQLLTGVEELSVLSVVDDLYEDDAPHGRPTIYFLASLITYMSVYGTQAPADYIVPETVHLNIQENYPEIVSFIWSRLEEFNFPTGESRVW